MKRNLLFLLMLCGMHVITAQTSIVCNSEGDLSALLTEKAKESKDLVISGPVNIEDICALNNYPQVETLDLAGAQLSVIPSGVWENLHSLRKLCLPSEIDTLYLDALSTQVYGIDICMSGKFPSLKNYPDDAPDYSFSLTKGNKVLTCDEKVGILSADGKILYKAAPLDGGDLYHAMEGYPQYYTVEKVCDYAFAQIIGLNGGYMTFSPALKEISNKAFVDFCITSITRSALSGSLFYVCFEGDTPPIKTGEGNLNIGIFDSENVDELGVVVPDVGVYVKSDETWGDLQIFSTSEWKEWKDQGQWQRIEHLNKVQFTDSYYDLQGRPITNPTRGIYIKDGKKVIIGQ